MVFLVRCLSLLIIVALPAFAATATTESLKMSGVKLSDLGPRANSFQRSTAINRSGWHTGWLSGLTYIENGICKNTQLLYGFGEASSVGEQIQSIFSGADCSPSSDGGSISASSVWIWSNLLTDYEFYNGEKKTGNMRIGLPDDLRQLINGEVRYTPEELTRYFNSCDGKCSAMAINAAMFSMANHFDEIGQKAAAGLWRYYALQAAQKSDVIRREASASLKRHAYTLYKHAVITADFGLAGWTTEVISELRFNDADATKINQHYDDWASAQKNDSFELGIVVTLSEANPVSASHSVAQRHISAGRLRLKVLDGALSYSFLECQTTSGSAQVLLDFKSREEWQVPADWQSCVVLLLGEKGSTIELWESSVADSETNTP